MLEPVVLDPLGSRFYKSEVSGSAYMYEELSYSEEILNMESQLTRHYSLWWPLRNRQPIPQWHLAAARPPLTATKRVPRLAEAEIGMASGAPKGSRNNTRTPRPRDRLAP